MSELTALMKVAQQATMDLSTMMREYMMWKMASCNPRKRKEMDDDSDDDNEENNPPSPHSS